MNVEDEVTLAFDQLKVLLESSLSGELPSETYLDVTNCGNLHTHIIYTDETKTKVHTIKADLGKSGTCPKAHLSSLCEFITGSFRYMSKHDRQKTLIMAAGHRCGSGVTCFDLLIRRLIKFE